MVEQTSFKKMWLSVQDFCGLWLQPILSSVALLSGAFLTYNFDGLRPRYPNWHGPISVIEVLLPSIFILSALGSLVVAIIVAKRGNTLKRLQADIEENSSQIAEIGNVIVILCDGLLLNLANKLSLTQGAQVRLSMYVHDSGHRAFVPCGRYSRNPNFKNPGRTSYPDNQGCIKKGWDNGWHFDNQFPSAAQPAKRREYALRNYGVPEAVTDAINMKSTLYAVKRLDNVEGRAIAVLVVEALDSDCFQESDLRAIIEGSEHDYARIVHELKAYVPNPASASERGL